MSGKRKEKNEIRSKTHSEFGKSELSYLKTKNNSKKKRKELLVPDPDHSLSLSSFSFPFSFDKRTIGFCCAYSSSFCFALIVFYLPCFSAHILIPDPELQPARTKTNLIEPIQLIILSNGFFPFLFSRFSSFFLIVPPVETIVKLISNE